MKRFVQRTSKESEEICSISNAMTKDTILLILTINLLVNVTYGLGTTTVVKHTEIDKLETRGHWEEKRLWKSRWVKHWIPKYIYVPVWKREWSPVIQKEWIPSTRSEPFEWQNWKDNDYGERTKTLVNEVVE